MTAAELIEILSAHPDYEVQLSTETMICPIKAVDVDCFDADEGLIFVIEADTTEEPA